MSVIQVGDLVQLRVSALVPRPVKSKHTIYKVETVPDNQVMGAPFWELSHDGDLYVMTGPITLVLIDGAP